MNQILNFKNFIKLVFIFSIFKILYSLIYGDRFFEMEWKILYYNLVNNSALSYYSINELLIPSVYMPPLYAYFLYLFSFLSLSETLTVKLILTSQCILSGLSIYIFFKILNNFFNEKYSYLISILYMIYPLNFYSSSQISSVSLQIFLFIFYLYFLINFEKKKFFIFFGIVSGLLILIRGEFWLLFLLSVFFLFCKNIKQFKIIILTVTISVLVISPYLIRNYLTFEKFILTKSSGYNLWRGNSDQFDINGDANSLQFKKDLKKIENKLVIENKIHLYEIYQDNYYYALAKDNIQKDPAAYFIHYLKKFFSFSIFNYNSNYPNYYNPLVLIPEIIISILAILGMLKNSLSNRKTQLILFVLLFYLFLIPVFFVLPRYKLFILPIYFIFAFSYLENVFLRRIFSKKQ